MNKGSAFSLCTVPANYIVYRLPWVPPFTRTFTYLIKTLHGQWCRLSSLSLFPEATLAHADVSSESRLPSLQHYTWQCLYAEGNNMKIKKFTKS